MSIRWAMLGIVLMTAVIFIFPVDRAAGNEEAEEAMIRLQDVSAKLLRSAEDQAYEQSLNEIAVLERNVRSLNQQYVFNEGQTRRLLAMTDQARQMVRQPESSSASLQWQALKLHLAIDAVTHPNQPLWKAYNSTYIRQIQTIQEMIVEKKQEKLLSLLEVNQSLFHTIEPSVALTQSPETAKQWSDYYQELFSYANASDVPWASMRTSAGELRRLAVTVFSSETSVPRSVAGRQSPLYIILVVGSFLIPALVYVAWRKYRGEKKMKVVR